MFLVNKVKTRRINKINRIRKKERYVKTCLKFLNHPEVQTRYTVNAILKKLQRMHLINGEQAYILEILGVTTEDLYRKPYFNVVKGVFAVKYSAELKTFSHALYYYSTKAYDYLREVVGLRLPHPNTIKKWFKSTNGKPGFTSEFLDALKFMAEKSDFPLYCCLTINEMQITRSIEWDGEKHQGYVDFGANLDTDADNEAGSALVFLVNGINTNWKVPVGYFLIDTANCQQKADLILQCLSLLHESNISVVGLTLDGYNPSLAIAQILGCKLDINNDLNTTFQHPITKQPIAVFLDICNMIDQVKISLLVFKKFIDETEKCISLEHLLELNRTTNAGTKLPNQEKSQDIQFLRKNVANIINDVCREKLSDADFKGLLPTANFITIVNNLFDVLNSRNIKQSCYEQPLCLDSKEVIFAFLDKAEKYIRSLRTMDGNLLIQSDKKIGYVGLLICIKSTKVMYQYLVAEKKISFLSMHRFSLNHLGLLFFEARAYSGNDCPTSKQFRSFYKTLVNYAKIKAEHDGKCPKIYQISLHKYSLPVQIINATKTRSMEYYYNDFDIKAPKSLKFDEYYTILRKLPEYSEYILPYVADIVVRNLSKIIQCRDCLNALYSPELSDYPLLGFKDKHGFLCPSNDVIRICKLTESIIRDVTLKPEFLKTLSLTKTFIINKVLYYFVNSDILNCIVDHQFDQSPMENHLVNLIKATASVYFDVRCSDLDFMIRIRNLKKKYSHKTLTIIG